MWEVVMRFRLYSRFVVIALVFAGAGISQELAVSNVQTASGSVYQVDNLSVGKNVYIDRDYTFSNVSVYGGQPYISTSNADPDVMNTSLDFLSFDINIQATVYVAYDNRVTIPSWLSGWTQTGNTLSSSLAFPQGASVYSKNFDAGTVVLGGNSSDQSMYIVIVAPGSGIKAPVPEFDRYMLLGFAESVTDAVLVNGTVEKHPEPLFGEDKPWEPRFDNVYASVVFDKSDSLYKCWYNPFIVDERTTSTPVDQRNPYDSPNYMGIQPYGRVIGLCYAYSEDGITWVKPELNLIEFEGSTANNIVMLEPHGVGVFLDEHETDPDKRFKAFFSSFDFVASSDMTVAFSADGIHWSDWVNASSIQSPGDTHNNAFWDPYTERYMGYTRWETQGGGRVVTFTQSDDFINWTQHYEVFGIYDDLYLQAHDMIVFPHGGIYIGLLGAMVFNEGTPEMYNVKQHVELTWSPDGENWTRINPGTPFIGNTPANGEPVYDETPFDWGTIFASRPVFLEDETRIYYGACNWYFFDWRRGYLALATIRPDRWAGYEPNGTGPAIVTTVPLKSLGSELCISADVANGGNVSVTLMDENDTVLAESDAVTDTVTDAVLTWKDGFSLSSVDRESIKLKFEFQNAEIYSFSFGDTAQVNVTAGNTEVPVPGHTLDLVRSSGRMLGINYSLRVPGDVRIRLFDMRGRCQAVLNEGRRQPGSYMASLNTSGFAAGAYTVHLKAGSLNFWKKVLICK